MFDSTRFLKYARGRLKLWTDFHKDYVSFVAVFQKLPETELAEYISNPQHKFISSEIAFVRSAPVEYLDLVKKVKLCTETEIDEILDFYDGAVALSEMSNKKRKKF
jgi:predicted transcriptional regulator